MKTIVFTLLLLFSNGAFAEDFYKLGQDAYVKGDYVTALKYLFAYRTVKEAELRQHPEFLAQLDASIKISEDNARNVFGHANAVVASVAHPINDPQLYAVIKTLNAHGMTVAPNAEGWQFAGSGDGTGDASMQALIKKLNAKGLTVAPKTDAGQKYLQTEIESQRATLNELQNAAQKK